MTLASPAALWFLAIGVVVQAPPPGTPILPFSTQPLMSAAEPIEAEPVPFEELVLRSPVATASDPEVTSIDLTLTVTPAPPGVATRSRCLYRRADEEIGRPEQVALILFDESDGTPVAWSDGTTLAAYDPIGFRLVVGSVAGLTFRAGQGGDAGGADVRLAARDEEYRALLLEQGGPFLLDLRSIVESDRRELRTAERWPDGSIRARILAPSGAELDISAEELGGAIRWTARGGPEADGSTFSLSVLINGEADGLPFDRATARPLIEGLPVFELADPSRPGRREPAAAGQVLGDLDQLLPRIILGRASIREQRARDHLSDIIGEHATDWGRILLRDRLIADRLRAYWGILAEPVPPIEPMPAPGPPPRRGTDFRPPRVPLQSP